MTRKKLWRGRPDRNTSPVESISHPPITYGFAVGISKEWKKSRALVGRRWPWVLGTTGRGVQLPPSAALGCHFDVPTWVLPPLPVLVLTESHPAEIPLCIQTCITSGNSSGCFRDLTSHCSCTTAVCSACGHREIRRGDRCSWRGVFENNAELGSELASTRTLQPHE